jgi:hypothetical protein
MAEPFPPLSEWGNYYVITGGAAAALTGLQFVVIALRNEALERAGEAAESAVRAFGTPTVLHLSAVLLVAAIMSIPRQSPTSLVVCVAVTGLAGLAFSARVLLLARRQRVYRPVLSDWIWHVAMPCVAYASLMAAALALRWSPGLALDVVGAGSLLLLFIGIRNAWDSAVWIAAGRH